MLPREWAGFVKPPPGHLLIIRDTPSTMKSGIYLPDTYRNRVRMVLASVVSVEGCPQLDGAVGPGSRVVIASSAGRSMYFGYLASDEIEMWVIEPRAVLMQITGEVNEAEDQGVHFLRNQKKLQARTPTVDDRWDEGDRQGPR